MAITIDDFNKIWASTSPLTPYTFSDANYRQGWNFVGATPPSRQMWDSIQNQNDEKLKYIVDNFLPLSGGTMLAPIGFNAQGQIGFRGTTHTDPNDICKQVVVTAGTVDSAWDDGNAKLCLHTYDDTGTNTAENGSFVLQASDGNGNSPFLEGTPNGDLKWNSKEVVTKKDEDISSSVTVTTNNGTVTGKHFYKVGNLVQGYIAWKISSQVAIGGTIQGDITGLPPRLSGITFVNGVTYYGSSTVILSISSTSYSIRVTGANLGANSEFSMSFIYATVN